MEIEVLKKDKSFLEDKNNSLLQEIRLIRDELLTKDDKIVDLKNTKKKLKNDLSKLNDLSKTKNMDEMLQTELEKIRTKSTEELKLQKKHAEDIHQNEVKILRDQLDHTIENTDKLELKLRSRERQYDDLMSEYRVIRSKLESECHELRSEIKVKSFELERLNL